MAKDDSFDNFEIYYRKWDTNSSEPAHKHDLHENYELA